MKLILATILFASIAGSALAQYSTSSNCYAIGNTEHCDSQTSGAPSGIAPIDFNATPLLQPPDYYSTFKNAFDVGRAAAAERREQAAREAAYREELDASTAARQEEQDRRGRAGAAGKLIESGHCEQARAVALDNGDLDLAAHVAALCPAR